MSRDGDDDEGFNDNTPAGEGSFENSVKLLEGLRLKYWTRVNASVSGRSKAVTRA